MVTPDEDLKAALLKARTLEDFLSAINSLNLYIFQMVIYKPLICPPS